MNVKVKGAVQEPYEKKNTIVSRMDLTKSLVETIGKAAVGMVALCYLVGLTVESLFLNRYDVATLSVLRLNYVVAGFWVLLPFLVISSFFIIGWIVFPRSQLNSEIEIYKEFEAWRKWLIFFIIIFFNYHDGLCDLLLV